MLPSPAAANQGKLIRHLRSHPGGNLFLRFPQYSDLSYSRFLLQWCRLGRNRATQDEPLDFCPGDLGVTPGQEKNILPSAIALGLQSANIIPVS